MIQMKTSVVTSTLITFTIAFIGCGQNRESPKIKSIETAEETVIFDIWGNPTQRTTRRFGETNVANYKNEYDSQNRLISIEGLMGSIPVAKSVHQYQQTKVIRTDSYVATKFGMVHKYAINEYNKLDSLSRKITFAHSGDTLRITSMSYNKENRRAGEAEKDFEHKFLTEKTFTYASYEKTEKILMSNMNASRDTVEFSETKTVFNTHGDIIKSERWELNRSILMVDDKEVTVSTKEVRNGINGYLDVSDFEYQYDQHGTCTQVDYYYNDVERNKKGKITTKRVIKYYE
jgi:hypothetical protein